MVAKHLLDKGEVYLKDRGDWFLGSRGVAAGSSKEEELATEYHGAVKWFLFLFMPLQGLKAEMEQN